MRLCATYIYLIIVNSLKLLLSTDAVTYGHIANSFPYKNTVDLVELKGKDLVQVLEQVASMYDEKKPSVSFLQVSGIYTCHLKLLSI